MALDGIEPSAARRAATSHSVDAEAAPAEPRALVVVQGSEPGERPVPFSRRPAAPFLAHLIATAHGEPQTRDRRRAEPQAAARAYAAAATRMNEAIAGNS